MVRKNPNQEILQRINRLEDITRNNNNHKKVSNDSINNHEEKYFHIPKKMFFPTILLFLGIFTFYISIWGLTNLYVEPEIHNWQSISFGLIFTLITTASLIAPLAYWLWKIMWRDSDDY